MKKSEFIKQVQQERTTLENKIAKLENKVSDLKERNKEWQTRCSFLQSRVHTLEGKADNGSEVERLRFENDKLLVELNSAKRKIQKQETKFNKIIEMIKGEL